MLTATSERLIGSLALAAATQFGHVAPQRTEAAPTIKSVTISGPVCLPDDETPQTYTVTIVGSGPGSFRYSVIDDDGALVDDTLVDERVGIPPFTCPGECWELEFEVELWCDTTFGDEVVGPDGCSDEGGDCDDPADVYALVEDPFGGDLAESARIDVCCCPAAEVASTRSVEPPAPPLRREPRNVVALAPDVPQRIAGDAERLVYDLETRRVLRSRAPQKRSIATFCYVNTDTVGFFTSPSVGAEIIDWGVLGGTSSTLCCGLAPIVSSFQFAYASSSADTSVGGPGAALTMSFYTSWSGFGLDSGNCPVATFAFSGLPGYSGSSTGVGTAYAFSVDLAGGGEFCMPVGTFGFGYSGDGRTGPLLCLTGDGLGGPEPGTGNVDAYDLWIPDTKGVNAGSFFFGGPPNNFASWYAGLALADLSGSPASIATRNGGGTNPPNSLACAGARLAQSLSLTATTPTGHLAAFALAFDSPFSFTLGGGQVLLCLDLGGNGELYTGSGVPLLAIGGGSFSATLPVPKDVGLCGFSFCTQAVFAFGATPFALSSACDITLGG